MTVKNQDKIQITYVTDIAKNCTEEYRTVRMYMTNYYLDNRVYAVWNYSKIYSKDTTEHSEETCIKHV